MVVTGGPDILFKSARHTVKGEIFAKYMYNVASLIRTPVWEPIPIPQQKVTRLSRNSVIRTVGLGTEVSR